MKSTKKKKLMGLFLAGIMAFAVTGCQSKNDVQDVKADNSGDVQEYAQTVHDSIAGQKSASSALTVSLKGSAENVMDIGFEGTMDTQVQFGKPAVTKSTLKGSLSLMGVAMDTEMQLYTSSDKSSEHTVYSKPKSHELESNWAQNKGNGCGVPALLDVDFYEDIKNDHVEATLEKDHETVGDKECAVITAKLTGVYLESAAGSFGEMLFGVKDVDWTKLQAEAKCYIDVSTNLPVQMTVDAAEAVGSGLEQVPDQLSMGITVSDCQLTYQADQWGEIEDIYMTEEVKTAPETDAEIQLYQDAIFNK